MSGIIKVFRQRARNTPHISEVRESMSVPSGTKPAQNCFIKLRMESNETFIMRPRCEAKQMSAE